MLRQLAITIFNVLSAFAIWYFTGGWMMEHADYGESITIGFGMIILSPFIIIAITLLLYNLQKNLINFLMSKDQKAILVICSILSTALTPLLIPLWQRSLILSVFIVIAMLIQAWVAIGIHIMPGKAHPIKQKR